MRPVSDYGGATRDIPLGALKLLHLGQNDYCMMEDALSTVRMEQAL